MGTRATYDITAELEVRYCLHGGGGFEITGQAYPDSNHFSELSRGQARALRDHLSKWLDAGPEGDE